MKKQLSEAEAQELSDIGVREVAALEAAHARAREERAELGIGPDESYYLSPEGVLYTGAEHRAYAQELEGLARRASSTVRFHDPPVLPGPIPRPEGFTPEELAHAESKGVLFAD